MYLLENFIDYINKHQLFQKKDSLLLAVSGGADSSVLCELCSKAGFNFAIAHGNFQLRREESDDDENFVKSLSLKYNVPFFVEKFDTKQYAEINRLSTQEAARKLRYNYFEKILTDHHYKFILTAHHADDNVETVMMNFFKGTGIKGLRGILPKQHNIIRPLLFATRNDIEQFAEENNIAFVTDSSNKKSDYTRNFLRNEIIPSLQKVYPQLSKNISNNINRYADIEYLYNEKVAELKKSLITVKGNEVLIPALKLLKSKPLHSVIFEIIQAYGFSAAQVNEVQKLLIAESGKYVSSATHIILKNRKWLIISEKEKQAQTQHILIQSKAEKIEFDNKIFTISAVKTVEKTFTNNPLEVLVNADNIEFPLLLRKWAPGDYFYPLGMDKKKKISRFFIDQKLSLIEKNNSWVLESDKKIIWVLGLRIDNRFKIIEDTKCILKLSLTL